MFKAIKASIGVCFAFLTGSLIAEDFQVDGHYLVGQVLVPIAIGKDAPFTLHVQKDVFADGAWTNNRLVYRDGRDPAQVFADTKKLWQTMYGDMVKSGMAPNVIQRMYEGIVGSPEKDGIWIKTGLAAAGYNGFLKSIQLNADAGVGTMAHESTHGWQFGLTDGAGKEETSILFIDLFAQWANLVYHTQVKHPEMLQGKNSSESWTLTPMDYGLQNNAEWVANAFSGWLYKEKNPAFNQTWLAMEKIEPRFVEFFNYIWKSGLSVHEAYSRAFKGVTGIQHPQYRPLDGVPSVEGFSKEDSTAIWKVCMNAPDKSKYVERFNEIIKRVAPNLPGSPAEHYKLGFGDANHDGIFDWIAFYDGPGPRGVGNGKYLWNRENKTGAYTFIVSGKKNDTYAEYKQDPYLTLPSMAGGALAQPQFREWQGRYGSCYGAGSFAGRTPQWLALFHEALR